VWLPPQGSTALMAGAAACRACGNRDPCSQARSGFAAECKAKMMVRFSQPSGPTAGPTRDLGQALNECPTAAVAIETMKAARRDVDRDGPALPR